jgi:hypothetical protein
VSLKLFSKLRGSAGLLFFGGTQAGPERVGLLLSLQDLWPSAGKPAGPPPPPPPPGRVCAPRLPAARLPLLLVRGPAARAPRPSPLRAPAVSMEARRVRVRAGRANPRAGRSGRCMREGGRAGERASANSLRFPSRMRLINWWPSWASSVWASRRFVRPG